METTIASRVAMIIAAAVAIFALFLLFRSTSDSSETFSMSSQPAAIPSMRDHNDRYGDRGHNQNQNRDTYPLPAALTPPPAAVSPSPSPSGGYDNDFTVLPSEPLSNEQNRRVDFGTGQQDGDGSQDDYPRRRLTAQDLLPKDAVNTRWAQVTPSGQGDQSDMNYLTASFNIGINTQGQSLRNPNMQLRSDPPNPTYKVSPWQMSTIEPDVSRRPFEIL